MLNLITNSKGNHRGSQLPRIFGVRWEDEDRGWQTAAVLAMTPEGAREVVENVLGSHVHSLVVLQ